MNLFRIPNTHILLLTLICFSVSAKANFNLRIQTDLGGIDIELFDTVASLTVENFMNYVDDGDYEGTFIHRSVPGFIVQGGGFIFDGPPGSFFSGGTTHIPTDPPVVNEFNLSNVRGTIAMAKLDGDPDSATSEWFFNLADNSENLDNQNGGFTVFAQVLGDGMDVVDTISALNRCIDVAPSFLCGEFPDVPAVDFESLNNDKLINIGHIGFDIEGDGAIDKLEDAAPNSGDGNNDAILDSTQENVASFPGSTDEYLTIEVSAPTTLKSLDILGATFALANPDTDGLLAGLDFRYGYAGFDLIGIPTSGSTEVVILTLPVGASPDTYFNFGPTSNDTTPHWYEFVFDGETGAEFNGNTVTLHFVDGRRGDDDLQSNGVIVASPGGSTRRPGDSDGVADDIEDAAPNNGDGNSDGVADSTQSNVASLLDINGVYVTVEAASTLSLQSLDFTNGAGLFTPENMPGFFEGLNLTHGVLGFEATGLNPGDATVVRLYLPPDVKPKAYMKFGPTPDDAVPHWYKFDFDGETGAVFDGNVVTLHFVDGKRGDSDLAANGVIIDPGAPAVNAENSGAGGGGGGGCSINPRGSHTLQAGAWWLLFAMLAMLRIQNLRKVPAKDWSAG